MHPSGLVAGVFLVLLIYWEAFETIVFPRRVSRRFRFTRAFYQATWVPWRAIGSRLKPGKKRENFLSIYGPISLLLLLVTWVGVLIVAFALLHWGGGSRLQTPAGLHGFIADLFLSGATLFTQWDRWSADLLETHISFPVLAYYRSQHDNQSWVAALTTILDVCALLIAGLERGPARSARLAFAMARHAAVDLSRAFRLTPRPTTPDRLTLVDLAQLRQALSAAGLPLRQGPEVDERLHRLRQMYEPYMNALGEFLLMRLPPWVSPKDAPDNWQSMA